MGLADNQGRDEVFAEALAIVREIFEWELAATRWDGAAQVLDALAEAAESDDLAAVRQAVADLELRGPVRITRIGATPVVPPPPPVRERLNHLVHRLSGGPGPERR
ncbi:CATRA system-associated protein [Actinomadura syzygii]|uniref:CATRA system-associated protein n=1 Tax=Actinomadura syzygii TaxID=1427538 RepID=UPI0016520F3F|nr:CATRA system-associated protein [Actinomadura syzygii]